MPQTDMQRSRRARTAQPPNARRQPSQAELATQDHVYGLVSVLYHALQGAEAYERYIDDAERAGDDELVLFFEECLDQESARASRAKRLLVQRIDETLEDEDDYGENESTDEEEER